MVGKTRENVYDNNTICIATLFVKPLQVLTRQLPSFIHSHPEWLLYISLLAMGVGVGSRPVMMQEFVAIAV